MNADTGSAYRSGHQLTLVVMALLIANIAASVLAIAVDWIQFELVSRIAGGEYYTDAELTRSDNLMILTSQFQLGIYILTGILFLVWLYRASRNLRAFDIEGLKFRPGWTVGWWFIPIFNIFRPYQAIAEVWRASSPPVGEESTAFSWRLAKEPRLLSFWWSFWLLSTFIGSIAGQIMYRAETPAEVMDATSLMAFTDAFDIVPAVLLVLVVRSIDRRQTGTGRRLGLENTPPPLIAGQVGA